MLKNRLQMRRKPGGREIGVFIFAVGRAVAPSPEITTRYHIQIFTELMVCVSNNWSITDKRKLVGFV